jgi:hypothetical protein
MSGFYQSRYKHSKFKAFFEHNTDIWNFDLSVCGIQSATISLVKVLLYLMWRGADVDKILCIINRKDCCFREMLIKH